MIRRISCCIYKKFSPGPPPRCSSRATARRRLPKEFRFNTREVEIYRRGNEVLREKAQNLSQLFEDLPPWPDDVVEPADAPPQEREAL